MRLQAYSGLIDNVLKLYYEGNIVPKDHTLSNLHKVDYYKESFLGRQPNLFPY